jgi:putative transcriptional regulator
MKPIHPDYPSLIKEIRKQLALSQEDLARELGVSYATVNRWENSQAIQTGPDPVGCVL